MECELEEEEQDSLPPLPPPLRTLTRTQTRVREGVEGSEVPEVLLSSAHTCSQLPSFQIGVQIIIVLPVVTIVAIVPLHTHHPCLSRCL